MDRMHVLKENLYALIMAKKSYYLAGSMLLAVGFAFGAAGPVVMDTESTGQCARQLQQSLQEMLAAGVSPAQTYLHAMLLYCSTCMIVLFAGLHMFGAPLIAAILFLKGTALGFTAGFLFYTQPWQTAMQSLLLLLPQNIIFLLLLLAISAEAFAFSFLQWKKREPVFSRRQGFLLQYGKMAFVALLGCTVAATVQCYVAPLFLQIGYWLP